jgi:hypothetical protein
MVCEFNASFAGAGDNPLNGSLGGMVWNGVVILGRELGRYYLGYWLRLAFSRLVPTILFLDY